MKARPHTGRAGTGAGFTLIELLAVVAIFALLAAVALPDFSLRGARAALDEAQQLAATFEYARQRAVMTGTPHRVALDLERARYRVEAEATDIDSGAAPDLTTEWGTEDTLPLVAPTIEEPVFRALSGPMGRSTALSDAVRFQAIELPEGLVSSGEVSVSFDRDGTSGFTEIWLEDPDGSAIVVTVEALADQVVVRRP